VGLKDADQTVGITAPVLNTPSPPVPRIGPSFWSLPARCEECVVMTANVIAFPPIRFSPADLALFDEISSGYLARGIWERVDRELNPEGDLLLVRHPKRPTPLFGFSRTVDGYAVLMRGNRRWVVVWRGDTAEKALAVWLKRARMPQPGQRAIAANA
jgi:hypothetical protein